MPEKNELINSVLSEICSLNNKISDQRKEQYRAFIESTVNGDTPITHLTIDANLAKDKPGIIIYILTNVRLIKIELGLDEIKSSGFLLDKLVVVERKIIDDDKAEVLIKFDNDSFGLRYPIKNQKITDFFQQVDQPRIKGLS